MAGRYQATLRHSARRRSRGTLGLRSKFVFGCAKRAKHVTSATSITPLGASEARYRPSTQPENLVL